MIKKLLFICLAVLLILPMSISCTSSKVPSTSLVPGTANAVLQIQVNKILTNSVLQVAYGELAKVNPTWPQTTNDLLNQFLQKAGIDLSSITTAVLFADIESTNASQNPYAGLIASGTFNESTLIANIQQQTKQTLTTSDYKGLTIYATAQDEFEIAFLSQSQIVFGAPKAVRDVIDVNMKSQQALSGSIVDALNRVGPALIVGAFAPPASLRSQLSGEAAQKSSISLKPLQNADTIGFAVDQPVLNLSVRIDAHFPSTASVQAAKDTVTSLISAAKGANQDPNVTAALNSIKVSTTDLWFSVQDLLNPAEIATLINVLQTQK